MPNSKLLIILISAIFILVLVNTYATFNLYNRVGGLTQIAPQNPSASPQPTAAPPEGQPSKIEVSMDDDTIKGQKDAPVTIVEFSDYQCPFCGRFVTETLPQIEEKYIKTEKVKMVFRDYPLPFHQSAQKASEASECAKEQGKFWEYHNKLFQNQNALTMENLKQYAADLKLDANKFNGCLDSGKMAEEVKNDMDDGIKYGVEGTPAFFINGELLVGAQPFSEFEKLIEKKLKEAQ